MNAAADHAALPLMDSRLLTAVAHGDEADLHGRHDGQRGVLNAATLREVCAGTHPHWPVQGRIQVTGARVRGCLDLSGAVLTHAVHFRDCVFEDPVDLRDARADQPVEWEGGHVRAILADRFEGDSDFTLRDAEVTGTVSLCWAHVGGDLRFTASRLRPQAGGRAIDGSGLRVDGTVFLDGENFHAQGPVRLRSAHINGDLDCRHASFSHPSGYSIDASHLKLDGELLCEEGFRSDGEVCLKWAKVHRVRATGGAFHARRARYALHADALRAEAGVYLDREFRATGAVRLVGANITGELCCTQGRFHNPDGMALHAERIVADDVYLDRGFRARGEVRFTGATVKRQFNATNGEFINKRSRGYALNADGLDCGGEVFLNEGFHSTGAVSLKGAEIASELNCTRGSFTNRGDYALFADGLTTRGLVYLDRGFKAFGEVRFARATVGRQLVCTDGLFDNQHGTALDITGLVAPGDVLLNAGDSGHGGFRATGKILMCSAVITRDLDFTGGRLHGGEGLDGRGTYVGGRLIWKPDGPPEGPVDLSYAQVDWIDDTPGSWAEENYTLAGLVYQIQPDGPMTVDQRIGWLKQATDYFPQAYQQLAQMYRTSGRERDAQQVAIASQRDLRKRGHLRPHSTVWNIFLDWTVGYGYRLHRAFLFLLAMGLIGWGLYTLGEHAGLMYPTNGSDVPAPQCPPSGYPCFNSFVYSFQLLIPGLDLPPSPGAGPSWPIPGWRSWPAGWLPLRSSRASAASSGGGDRRAVGSPGRLRATPAAPDRLGA
jgi:hypothetical protein